MANKHFGNAGDVFKHFMLGELLRAAVVTDYLETHAGSACYPLAGEPSRSLGWRQFSSDPDSAYGGLLFQAEQAGVYPGSALLAMRELPTARIHLFDTDPNSISSLQTAALPHPHVHCILADGLKGAIAASAELTFIDPFDPNSGQPDSLAVFRALADQGRAVVLWYPLLDTAPEAPDVDCEKIYEIRFRQEYDQELLGCGILVSGLEGLGTGVGPRLDRTYADFSRRWRDYLR